jgi:hypothetical protein
MNTLHDKDEIEHRATSNSSEKETKIESNTNTKTSS